MRYDSDIDKRSRRSEPIVGGSREDLTRIEVFTHCAKGSSTLCFRYFFPPECECARAMRRQNEGISYKQIHEKLSEDEEIQFSEL